MAGSGEFRRARAPARSALGACRGAALAGVVFALAGCGGDSGDDAPPRTLGTLAYVETECRDTREGFVERQALRIRQGEREPVTVFETPGVGPIAGVAGLCRQVTSGRFGGGSITREAFQAVSVSPDGAAVVFEVTDAFSIKPPLPLDLPPEQKGIFWVRADGTGLRRLGPPSRTPFFDITPAGNLAEALGFHLNFSPDGWTIAFADKGLDGAGHEADQVFTLDVATGTRTQVTDLPPAVPPPENSPNSPTIWTPRFLDRQTLNFGSSANPDGLNPRGDWALMTIRTDGSGFDVPLPVPVAVPGGTIELRFVITGDRPQVRDLNMPDIATNPLGDFRYSYEIFVIDEGGNILQLTNFHRSDTWSAIVDIDREHVYFTASADPLGTNPSNNCQIFSTDRLHGDLRQLTNFGGTKHSAFGCAYGPRSGGDCAVGPLRQDARSRDLVFYSDCNPLGTNPRGGQIFAMQPDGSGLRQWTASRGLVREADGTYTGELPGPWAYGPYVP